MYFPKPAINENDLAIIERGDTAEHSIGAGQYVSWKGKLGKAVSAILQGATLDDNLFSYEEDGALNAVKNDAVLLGSTGSTSYVTYTVSDLAKYKFFFLICTTTDNRILASGVVSKQLFDTNADHTVIYPAEQSVYAAIVKRESSTTFQLKTRSQYDVAWFYGVA